MTTSLTIYGFGLRGNSANESIGKHRFRTKKHQKVNKSSQKNDGVFVRELEAASSSPATSTNRKSRVYPCFFYWSNLVGERSLQAARTRLVFSFLVRLDAELARRSSESRHFDHMKIIRTFSCLESRSDYLFYLSIPILIARNENSLRQRLTLSEAFSLTIELHRIND